MSGATDGTCLRDLIRMAVPLCRAAQGDTARTGPGRKPEFADWQLAVLIMIAVLHQRKSKSAQYRFLEGRAEALCGLLDLPRFPQRSTYFERYRTAHPVFAAAIRRQGQQALAEGAADARTVAVDKSLVAARGPQWHPRDRRRGQVPKGLCGVDRDSDWGRSPYHGWVQGYSFEAVVSAPRKGGRVFPLLASAGPASRSEPRSFAAQIPHLPPTTRNVLADTGYDNNAYGDAVEHDAQGRRTGRHFLCPANRRGRGPRPRRGRRRRPVPPTPAGRRRAQRLAYLRRPTSQRLYRRRSQTVEPFHERLKALFELTDHVWHRGLENNQTQLLAAIFCYQLLLRYHHRLGLPHAQVQWILDKL
jgi:hypothetical protein